MSTNPEETVTIKRSEFVALVKADCELDALRAVGVDCWLGWGEHCEYRDQLIKERLGAEYVEDL